MLYFSGTREIRICAKLFNIATEMSSSYNQIVVIGSCMVDFVSYAPRLPKSGETIHGSKFVTNFGGKGANQCIAAAKLGGQTTLVARVGDDIWAKKYIESLQKNNVQVEHVKGTESFSTGAAQIIVSESGENQIVIVAGANNKLSVDDVNFAQDVISNAAVIVLQLETSVNVAIRACQLCKGISILNGAPALSQFDPQLLTLPTIFCVNESEATVFTGLPVNNKSEAEAAAINLLSLGCKSVIITLGSQGAVYVNNVEREFIHIPSPSVKCVDSTGAGDAFIGALAYLLANKELGMQKSIELACLVAADSVTRPGTQISFPGPEILKNFM